MKIFTALLVILFLSCNIEDNNRSNDDIKGDLSQLVQLIPVLKASLSLTNESSIIESRSFSDSRAITPGQVLESSDTQMSKYFGANWNDKDEANAWLTFKPTEVYNNSGIASEIDTQTNTLRIPQSGVINGLYGKSDTDFYIELEEIQTGVKYRVMLYIYPRSDFNIEYIYEEYIVSDEGSWAWAPLDNGGQEGVLIKDIAYYRDGSVKDRVTTWTGSNRINEVYSNAPALDFEIDDLISDSTDYLYPASEPIFTYSDVSDTTVFRSRTTGSIKGISGGTFSITEYYSEENGNKAYNLQLIERSKKWTFVKEVNRAYSNLTTLDSNFIALRESGTKWYTTTEMEKIKKTATTYYSEKHLWYDELSNITETDNANSIILNLEKSGDVYQGTSTQFWGSTGEKYNYTINTLTGEISTSWLQSTTRNLTSQNILITDIKNFTISSGNWSFKGSYDLGELIGVYNYNGDKYDVAIDLLGLVIEDEKYKWE